MAVTDSIVLSYFVTCMTIIYDIILYSLFFFLNQQFITQGMRAGHSSYFVTTYKISKLHEQEK